MHFYITSSLHHRKMCDPNLLTFSREGSHLMEGLDSAQFTLKNRNDLNLDVMLSVVY